MNPLLEELRQLREQQNVDFEIHTERLNAHASSIRRYGEQIGELQTGFNNLSEKNDELSTKVNDLSARVDDLSRTVSDLSRTVSDVAGETHSIQAIVARLVTSSADMLATTEASQESFKVYRLRHERILDVLQASAMTGRFEQDSRVERLDQRVTEIEKRFPAA